MILIVIFAVTAVAVAAVTHVTVLGIILGVIAAGWYYVRDVKRHPRVSCRFCGGSGDHQSRLGRGVMLRRPAGNCGHCGGKKGVPRPALWLVDSGQRKKIIAGIVTAKKAMRR